MCGTSLVAASKERQTGAKSCKAGKLHSADEIISFTLDECESPLWRILLGTDLPIGTLIRLSRLGAGLNPRAGALPQRDLIWDRRLRKAEATDS